MSKIVINDTIEIDILPSGKDTSSQSIFFGQITKEKRFRISDPTNEYNPFVPGSVLSGYPWKNAKVEEQDDDGNLIWRGQIRDIQYDLTQNQSIVTIIGVETLAILLGINVESLTKKTWVLGDNIGIGYNTVPVSGHAEIIEELATCYFDNGSGKLEIYPRYAIIEQQDDGSKTTQITLDRGVQKYRASGSLIVIGTPRLRTAAEEIKETLDTALPGIQWGSNVASIISEDDEASRFIWINVRDEDKTSLSNHIAELTKISGLQILRYASGVIDIIRGWGWSGQDSLTVITDNEIQNPLHMFYDEQNLILGYQCFYKSGKHVINEIKLTSEFIISQSGAKEYWTPIQGSQNNPFDYRYLFGSQATAQYYGDRRLAYYQYKKIVFSGSVSSTVYNSIEPYNLELGQEAKITLEINNEISLENTPCIIKAVNYNPDTKKYTSVTFEVLI